jgi:protein-S-isoprenylcysteine O-methyltransferase Ste14
VPAITAKYKYFGANLAALWLAVLFYSKNRFYINFLNSRYTLDLGTIHGKPLTLGLQTQGILFCLAIAYTVLGFLYYWRTQPTEPSHAFIAIQAICRWLKLARLCLTRFPHAPALPVSVVSSQERVSLLFLLLKFLYLPMMIEFMLANWTLLAGRWWSYSGVMRLPRLEAFNNFVFPCLIDVFFITECALYAFGYAVESRRCRNLVKSVDPTFLGWAVALACYPPFNSLLNNYVGWYTSDDPTFQHDWVTCIAKCAILFCFFVYLWGAISLGTKCSNLTNRGIVTTGAFAWVRHPAYAGKNLAWWIAMLTQLSLTAGWSKGLARPILTMAFWSFIYFMRAITEERHLSNDPDYVTYAQKVRYRFIPGVL